MRDRCNYKMSRTTAVAGRMSASSPSIGIRNNKRRAAQSARRVRRSLSLCRQCVHQRRSRACGTRYVKCVSTRWRTLALRAAGRRAYRAPLDLSPHNSKQKKYIYIYIYVCVCVCVCLQNPSSSLQQLPTACSKQPSVAWRVRL
jgi:hypothetical protein